MGIAQAGMLLAMGFLPKVVRRMFLSEVAVIAMLAAALGAAGGMLYTDAPLHAATLMKWRKTWLQSSRKKWNTGVMRCQSRRRATGLHP